MNPTAGSSFLGCPEDEKKAYRNSER